MGPHFMLLLSVYELYSNIMIEIKLFQIRRVSFTCNLEQLQVKDTHLISVQTIVSLVPTRNSSESRAGSEL